MNIDMHLHAMPEAFLDLLKRDGIPGVPVKIEMDQAGEGMLTLGTAEWTRTFPIERTWYDTKLVIRDIDRMQLDVVAVTVVSGLSLYWAPPEVGEVVCRAVNDSLAQMVRSAPDRFVGFANVPLQDPLRAAAEAERAVKQLGFRGVNILSNVNGKDYDDESFLPFFQKVAELDVPIFIHPLYTASSDPFGKGRLSRYYTMNYIGNPGETTIAAASLIFGGVLERVPNLKVILAHGGGTLPYLIGRFDHGFGVRDESKVRIKRRPSEYFEKLYFDTVVHNPEVLAFMVNFVGPEKVVIGTDYPADMATSEPVARVQALPISRADRRRILSENAAALMKL